MKRLILATKLLALNPSAATRLTATRLTATHLAATHLTVWIFLWAALFGVAIPTSSYAQVAEICANGIDDDGDTLIDCDDSDCTFQLFSDSSYGNSWSFDVALGDLDGDGDLDAWVANGGETIANCVWINQSGDQGGTPGTFADSGQALGNSSSLGIALGDLDGDGDLDAWVANYSDSSGFGQANRVWVNQGGDQGGTPGTFADSNQDLGSSESIGVALGDLDGDGDLDAWVVNFFGQANHVWINQGGDQGGIPGTYADSGQALGNSEATDVALGDLDGDGDLDAWVTNYFGQANRVWINQVSCEETPFIRGDVNADGGIDFSDAVTTLDYLFTGGSIGCEKAADSNDDGATNIVDGIALLGYLFSGTGDLPMPFPTCGIDPTKDTLECETFTVCP